jgi:hypothetical protein
MTNLIIAGTRTFNDYELLEMETARFMKENNLKLPISIVSGKARGADSLGETFAKKFGFPIIEKPADWDNITGISPVYIKYNKFGKAYNSRAGHDRNEEMAKISQYCIIFHDGKSTGSMNMKENCEKYELTYKIIKYEN